MSRKIYILPVGDLKSVPIAALCPDLEKEFDANCAVLAPQPLPHEVYDPKREQFFSTAILDRVRYLLPPDALRLLAVVDVDLFVPELNFVFGEAAASYRAAVISAFRLHPSGEAVALFHQRLLTEAVHELGHTFGLGHCDDPHCVMFFSNRLSDTDRKGPHFCERCRRRLK